MPKTKYKKRPDGRYLKQIIVGIKDDGSYAVKNIYGRTIEELERKIDAYKDDTKNGIGIPEKKATLGQWAYTYCDLFKKDKEKYIIPKGVQDVIPVKRIWRDGVFLVGKNKYSKTFKFTDLIKGEREIHENCKDIVLMKSNGIPPYSLAHVVDDTLMHTTIVVRGEEWWASLAAHLEIFNALGIKPPKYAHSPVISKLDENSGNKRKLSKRYDPEADTRFFVTEGYPTVALNEYLLNLINSDFENWRKSNPDLPYTDFPFSLRKISSSNPMFDLVKINDISKNIISKIPAKQLLRNIVDWANNFDEEFAKVLLLNQIKAEKLLTIDRENERPRKDIAHYSEVKNLYSYMFNEYFDPKTTLNFDSKFKKSTILKFLNEYLLAYSPEDDKQEWFDRLKTRAADCGFVDMKTYKANPEMYEGNVADASNILRVALTGKTNTPDLYEIMKVLGTGEIRQRLQYVIQKLK